jgi:uncharacterized protein YbcV (DUF1398 family)
MTEWNAGYSECTERNPHCVSSYGAQWHSDIKEMKYSFWKYEFKIYTVGIWLWMTNCNKHESTRHALVEDDIYSNTVVKTRQDDSLQILTCFSNMQIYIS